VLGWRPRSDSDATVLHGDPDLVLPEVEPDLHRPGLGAVGVQDHVVACLADGRLEIVEQLGIDRQQLGNTSEHPSHQGQRLGPAFEVEPHGWSFCDHISSHRISRRRAR
jgi:hypothetical protein